MNETGRRPGGARRAAVALALCAAAASWTACSDDGLGGLAAGGDVDAGAGGGSGDGVSDPDLGGDPDLPPPDVAPDPGPDDADDGGDGPPDPGPADGAADDGAVQEELPPEEGCTEDECEIDGVCVANEAPHPDNPCELCLVLVDPFAWTPNDAASCDDASACTTDDRCEDGACVGDAVDCGDGNPCTDDACLPTTGECLYADNAAPCSDGNACTAGDGCVSGGCVAGDGVTCDDGNPCTADGCDPQAGCVHDPLTGTCDDGDPCTVGDACAGGKCVPGPEESCDDGDLCTVDACTPGGCQHTSVASLCEDASPCTDEACDPEQGCVYPFNTAPCDDGSACTAGDVCTGGACIGVGIPADDGNVCTDDFCDPLSGVFHQPNTVPCNDGNACTVGDTCGDGSCQAGATSLACDDGNACTTDACDPASGCVATPNADPCDDGSVCTTGDVCSLGACGGAAISCDDGNACTTDSCHPQNGCQHTLVVSNACRPTLTVTYPPRAATIQSTTQIVQVTGSVASGAGAITALTLNGEAVTVAADGSFAHAITPQVGGNTLAFVATDAMGTQRKRVQAFLWSPTYRKPTDPVAKTGIVDPGMGIWMAQEVIDDGDRSLPPDDLATIFNLILQGFDLNGLLPNPVAEDMDGGAAGTYDVFLSNLAWGTTQTTLTSQAGGLKLTAVIPNVTADLQANKTCSYSIFNPLYCVGPGTINGTIAISSITITGNIALTVNAQHQIVPQLLNSAVTIGNVTVNIDSWLAFIIEPIIQGAVNDFKPDLEAQFNAQIQNVIGPLLGDALQALAFNLTFDFPKLDNSGDVITIQLVSDFAAVSFQPPGGEIRLRAGAYAQKTVAYDNLGAMGRAGCNLGPQPVAFSKAQPFELALGDDVLNQLLYAAWSGGLLEFPVPPTLLGNLDLASFGISELQLNVSGMLQPTASDCNPDAELLLHVGDLRIDATLKLFGQPMTVVVYATFEAGLNLTADPSGIAITLTEIVAADTEVTVLEDNLIGSEPVIDGLIADNLIPALLDALGGGGALASFPLPEIDLSGAVQGLPPGTVIAIDPKVVSRIQGNTSVGGTLK